MNLTQNNTRVVAIVSFSDIEQDGRIHRQIESLSSTHSVKVIGFGKMPAPLSDMAEMIPVKKSGGIKKYIVTVFFLLLGREIGRAHV